MPSSWSLAFLWPVMIIAPLVLVAAGYLTFYIQPQFLVAAVQSRFNRQSVLFYVDTPLPRIALTIDDSPSNATGALLDELKASGVKATFFLISSYIHGREKLIERMVAEGHELANHMVRDEPSWRLPLHQFEKDLVECESVIRRYQKPQGHKWFRPGQGFFTDQMLQVLNSLDYRLVLGNIFPNDANGFNRLQSDWPALNSLYLRTRARPGGIIVIHDRPWTVEVLQRALPDLTSRFEVVTLSELVNTETVRDGDELVGGKGLRGAQSGMLRTRGRGTGEKGLGLRGTSEGASDLSQD